MKKVIHAPTVGKPKTLLDYESAVGSLENHEYSNAETHGSRVSSPVTLEKVEEYRTLIDKLRQDSKELLNEKNVLEKKYHILEETIADHIKEAKDQGYRYGILKAESEIQSAVEEKVVIGETLLNEIKKGILSDIYDQEDICLEIIYSAISRLIADSAGSKEQIKAILKLTIDKIAAPDNLHIYVSAKDYEQLKNDEFSLHKLIQSDELEYGGCIIKTGKGTVESKLDDQLVKLKKVLLDIHKTR